jgi:hypothetical protein
MRKLEAVERMKGGTRGCIGRERENATSYKEIESFNASG